MPRGLALLLPLGLASGLPLPLTGQTLQAWLTLQGADLATIGWYSLLGLPYVLKFLWAPLVDAVRGVWGVDGRRTVMAAMQVLIAALLGALALTDAAPDLAVAGVLVLLLAVASATQDLAFDAWRAEVLPPGERAAGTATSVLGYRLGMLLAGAFALVLADAWGFQACFAALAVVMLAAVPVTLAAPAVPVRPRGGPGLRAELRAAVADFAALPGLGLLLALVATYKLGDAWTGILSTTFLQRTGFELATIGWVYKGLGLAALLAGTAVGGWATGRLGLPRALLLFGVAQALTNLGFWGLALAGPSTLLLALVVAAENAAAGMGTVALLALMIGLCRGRWTATQFALLSAVAALARVFLAPVAGPAAEALGWGSFFLVGVLAALPGLVLVMLARGAIARVEEEGRPPAAPAVAA